ncbi:hypothetical protein SEA_SPILLED_286 [Streptomyces phage Spilled]|jgi:ribosomal protein L7/L12|uniref:Uncharacterized protein n=4 Tax=root TaxID=1 RepID=A0A890UY86_9CAUD|nr:hypothetical protein HWB80_gp019 [Streptomyces phage Karimac]YP_009840406.1 hypothetical protein HWB80_gp046 [Streptomyces phage Karimac]QDF17194.1 hypothetical protein SEA_BIRCHLYN_16 [Streptomyces phage Birchlyn]QFP97335.1 hypothetical protein SEA_ICHABODCRANE_18 [Streptomyces phage IchabodCrane]QGH74265.1 hypothetical protein SEA_WIPEOUT_18 [Streptomyces phage Wipeout]QGH78907.1 hypothetical protein SEA_TOMSAWYER_19 [Streptomyces phage TomSawyer]QGH79792.1 hypothetical protein SEA_BORDE
MERIEIVQQVGNYFPDTKIADALRFAGDIDRGFRRKMEDARYKAEDEKYEYAEKRYNEGVQAGKDSIRTTFDPKVVEATTWAIMNFTERDFTRKITCIKVLRDKFRPLGLIEAKSIVDMITPLGKTDALDWPKIEKAEKDSPREEPQGLAQWEKDLLEGTPEPELATQSALNALRNKLTNNDVARESIESEESSYNEGPCPCGCGMGED